MVRSMFSGVSGMKAHQARMDVIGNNIANVNTYGFKASRASFREVYYQTMNSASGATANRGGTNPSQIGYGVQLGGVDVIHTRSAFAMTDNGMDVAIAGEGFFQVQDADGNIFYTRSGILNVDSAGNLVDMNGNFVLGVSGNPLGAAPGKDKIQLSIPSVNPAAAKAEETINNVKFNITASNNNADGNVTFSFIEDGELPLGQKVKAEITTSGISLRINKAENFSSLAALNSAINDAITEANGGKQHPAGTFDISMNPAGAFPAGGLTGAQIVSKDFSTTPGKVEFAAGTTDLLGLKFNTTGSKFSGTGNQAMTVTANAAVAPATGTASYTISVGAYTYNLPASATAAGKIELTNGTSGDTIILDHPGFTALDTAFNAPGATTTTNVDLTPAEPSQNLGLVSKPIKLSGGTSGGEQNVSDLSSIGIGADGVIEAVHAVHGRLQLGRIDIVTFQNPQGLEQKGNTYFTATANSGQANYCAPGSSGSGALAAGSLEMSNVDLSKEFADMITTQRGFQANSRLITVSDEMLNELVNLKR